MFSKLFNKKTKFFQEFTMRDLSLELESGWSEYFDKNDENRGSPLTFIKEKDGAGALQISFATSEKNQKFDINEHLEKGNKIHAIGLKDYKLRDWTVYEYEEKKDGHYLKTFYFVKPKVVAYVTYTVGLEHREEKQLNEAIKIAKTLEITSKN